MGVGDRDEARIGTAEDELIALAILSRDTHTTAVVMNGDDRASLRVASKVLDASTRANAW